MAEGEDGDQNEPQINRRSTNQVQQRDNRKKKKTSRRKGGDNVISHSILKNTTLYMNGGNVCNNNRSRPPNHPYRGTDPMIFWFVVAIVAILALVLIAWIVVGHSGTFISGNQGSTIHAAGRDSNKP